MQIADQGEGQEEAKKLNSTGKVKVKPKITYTPTGGERGHQSVKVKLIKR